MKDELKLDGRLIDTLKGYKVDGRVLRMDSDQQYFLSRELESIRSEYLETIYKENKARMVLPVVSRDMASAASVVVRREDMFGEAEIVSDYATVAGAGAEATAEETSYPIRTLSNFYRYSVHELALAVATNRRLDAARARACRESIERKLDNLAASGDADFGLGGFLNDSNVSNTVAANGAGGSPGWSTKTGDEMNKDIIDAIDDIGATVGYGLVPDKSITVIVPDSQYALLANTRLSDTGESALSYIQRTHPKLREVAAWHKCAGAGTGSSDLLVAYIRDPRYVELCIPQDIQEMEPQLNFMAYHINMNLRTAATIVHQPLFMSYVYSI